VCVPAADNIPAMPVHDLPRERRDDVAEILRTAVAAEHDVAFAYLHGSFLSDAPFRDVDLAVYFAPGGEHPDDQGLLLGECLSRIVGLPVDVRALNTAPLTFRFHAVRGRLLAARDERVLSEVLEETMRRYFDAAPLLAQATREAFGA
jgi:uncharacterized protein